MNRGLGAVFLSYLLLYGTPLVAEGDNLDPEQTIQQYYTEASGLFTRNLSANQLAAEINKMVVGLFYADRFAPQLLQNEWRKLTAHDQKSFKQALLKSISRNLQAELEQLKTPGFPALRLKNQEIQERFARLDFVVGKGPSRKEREFSVSLLKDPLGSWRITTISSGKESLLQHYYKISDRLIDDYSFAYLVAELSGQGYVVLEDFEGCEIGTLPKGWTWKSKDDSKNKPYRVASEDGNKYLEATDRGESVILGKDVNWDIRKYPYVSFRWRGKELPKGGDERYGRSVDSAAGIYFVYKKKLGLIPESVKYVWSTTLPRGSAMRRSGTGRPWMVVAESGEENLGKWRTYVFNLYEAYQKTFGGDPPDKPIGIGILSDANSTDSKAFADYDDIRALSKADAGSGVDQILEAE